MRQKSPNLDGTHIFRMTLAVKQDETLDPLYILRFSANAEKSRGQVLTFASAEHSYGKRQDLTPFCAKQPLGGPAQVLEYLGRYTHRVAISNERILGMEGNNVCFRMRDSANGNRKKVMRLDAGEFIGRFMQHILPGSFKRIRHYGLLGPAHKTANLAAARKALEMPAPEPLVVESLEAFMRRVASIEWLNCPHCREGQFRVMQAILPNLPRAPPRKPP